MKPLITNDELKVLKEAVLQKLNNYLNNVETKEEVFKWAEQILISSKFDAIDEKDKILSEAIQVLYELHHPDGKFDPTQEELIFYKKKLEESMK